MVNVKSAPCLRSIAVAVHLVTEVGVRRSVGIMSGMMDGGCEIDDGVDAIKVIVLGHVKLVAGTNRS